MCLLYKYVNENMYIRLDLNTKMRVLCSQQASKAKDAARTSKHVHVLMKIMAAAINTVQQTFYTFVLYYTQNTGDEV